MPNIEPNNCFTFQFNLGYKQTDTARSRESPGVGVRGARSLLITEDVAMVTSDCPQCTQHQTWTIWTRQVDQCSAFLLTRYKQKVFSTLPRPLQAILCIYYLHQICVGSSYHIYRGLGKRALTVLASYVDLWTCWGYRLSLDVM